MTSVALPKAAFVAWAAERQAAYAAHRRRWAWQCFALGIIRKAIPAVRPLTGRNAA